MFVNHCGNIKINDNEDKKQSMNNCNDKNKISSPFKNVDKNDFMLFDKVFRKVMKL